MIVLGCGCLVIATLGCCVNVDGRSNRQQTIIKLIKIIHDNGDAGSEEVWSQAGTTGVCVR